MQKTVTFLMFVGDKCGKAEEAMKFYTSLFKNSDIKSIHHFKKDEPGGREGFIKQGYFTLDGLEYMAIDSPMEHKFSFNPSISIFVNCDDDKEFEKLYHKLSENGEIMMPPGDYGFSKKFAWLSDRFGISWQLNY